jgi:predicted dehydrogenase
MEDHRMKQYGWGILGLGIIARRFMNDLPRCPQAVLAAAASRSPEKAREFAEKFGFARYYGSYQELLADPAVDIVYVATTHNVHRDLTIEALEAGKAVLCEKPAAVNAAQLRDILDCARRHESFFMEGMWTRFFPVNQQIKRLIASGELGAVRLIHVDFGHAGSRERTRFFTPETAGGSLLDVGVYCVSYAAWLKGERPTDIKALDSRIDTGVDGTTVILFRYADGSLAKLSASMMLKTRHEALVYCEKGMIEVPDFWHPSRAIVHYDEKGRPDVNIEIPYDQDGANGFKFEAAAVMDCLDHGLKECPEVSWQQSLEVMEQLDAVRRETGLKYPWD